MQSVNGAQVSKISQLSVVPHLPSLIGTPAINQLSISSIIYHLDNGVFILFLSNLEQIQTASTTCGLWVFHLPSSYFNTVVRKGEMQVIAFCNNSIILMNSKDNQLKLNIQYTLLMPNDALITFITTVVSQDTHTHTHSHREASIKSHLACVFFPKLKLSELMTSILSQIGCECVCSAELTSGRQPQESLHNTFHGW